MAVLLLLQKVLLYCSFALLMVMFLMAINTKGSQKDDAKHTCQKEKGSWIDTTEIIIVLILLCVFVMIIMPRFKSALWSKTIEFGFAALFILIIIINSYFSFFTIRGIVNSREKKEISSAEVSALGATMSVAFFAGVLRIPEELIEQTTRIRNIMISDFLHIFVFGAFVFIYLFLIFAILPLPLAGFSKLFCVLHERIGHKFKSHRLSHFYTALTRAPTICGKHFLRQSYCKYTDKKVAVQILIVLISPILLIVDIVEIVLLSFWVLIFEMLRLVLFLLGHAKQSIVKVLGWTATLSNSRVVALSFRVSIIVTLVLMVIINRYQPLGKQVEESTAVLEFIASAILIPMVFSWISEYKSAMK